MGYESLVSIESALSKAEAPARRYSCQLTQFNSEFIESAATVIVRRFSARAMVAAPHLPGTARCRFFLLIIAFKQIRADNAAQWPGASDQLSIERPLLAGEAVHALHLMRTPLCCCCCCFTVLPVCQPLCSRYYIMCIQ